MKVFSILGVLLFCLGCVRLQLGSPVIIDPSRDYLISYEDSVYNYYEGQTKITADLLVDGCGDWRNMCEIKFSDCKLNGDTLDIEIFETNSVVDYHYKIKVWEGRFKIDYWYQTTIDTAIRKIETVNRHCSWTREHLTKETLLGDIPNIKDNALRAVTRQRCNRFM